jgi:predicted DNA-binding transcriptional regulator
METKKHEPIIYKVYEFLKEHVGEKNSASAEAISFFFDISEREVRRIVQEIRRSGTLEKIIGSSNTGYFICTADGVEKANRRLFSQAFSLLKTARENERKAGLDGQMKLKLGAAYKDVFEALGRISDVENANDFNISEDF